MGTIIPKTSLSTLLRRSFSRPRLNQISSRSFAAAKPLSPFVDGEGWGATDPSIFCRDYIRTNDYESYLVAQAWPKELQRSYYAIKAFSVELAAIQDSVSNSMIAKMRLQFWRDALRGIADGRPPRHPIALALYEAGLKRHLPMYHFKRIIDARDAELHSFTHLTMDSLTAHAESTASTTLYLLLALIAPAPARSSSSPQPPHAPHPHQHPHVSPAGSLDTFSHAASHLGTATTLATLLRALPFHASKGRMVIPAELTAKHGVVWEDVLRGVGIRDGAGTVNERAKAKKALEEAVFEFATIANDHLITARDMFKGENDTTGKVPRQVMPVFLSGVPISSFLMRLEKVNFDAFHPSLRIRDWKSPWYVWKGYLKGMF